MCCSGSLSPGLVDVDLDSTEACQLAPQFLPPTNAIFGRACKRGSHRLYVALPPPATEQFEDVAATADDKAMHV